MNNYRKRLHDVIPGGAHTYSRGDDQYPSNAPAILECGKGAYVWDADGKKLLDYGMALRAVTLGYAHDRVNQAAIRQIEKGVNLTRASVVELEAAELMVDLIPSAEMVKFAKNGSNVTTAATKIARAYTGRKYICIPRQQPFFSFDDWFIGTTAIKRGIPEEHYATTLVFEYGDIESLETLFQLHPGQIAGVLLEPATALTPCPPGCPGPSIPGASACACAGDKRNFLHAVQDLCRKNGALFILDEMITGFRWNLQGAQVHFGVEPDLSTFGKAMANGFSVAALVGKREFMKVGAINEEGAERTFLISTTHGAEMSALGAFIEAVAIYKESNVIQHLWNYGKKLSDGVRVIATSLDLQDYFYLEGNAVSLNYVTKDKDKKVSLGYRTLFAQEMIRNGVFMPWIAFSLAHTDMELEMTLAAVEKSLRVYQKALGSDISAYLEGPVIKPVFRRTN